MQTIQLKTWAALLLTAAAPLTVSAAAGDNVLLTTATTVIESNTTHLSNDTINSAIQITASGAVYSGTNITVSGTALSGDGRYGAYVNGQSFISLYSSTLSTVGDNAYALFLRYGSVGNLTDVYANTTGTGSFAISVATSSTLTVSKGTLVVTAYGGRGINFDTQATGYLSDVHITTEGDQALGIHLNHGSQGYFSDIDVATSGTGSFGIVLNNDAYMELTTSKIVTTGEGSDAVYANGRLIEAHIVDSEINATGTKAAGVYLDGGDSLLEINSSSIISAQGDGIKINDRNSETYAITINQSTVTGKDNALNLLGNGTNTVNISGSSSLTGDLSGSDSSNTSVNLDNSTLTGNVNSNDNAVIDLTVSGSNGSIIGDITQSGSSAITVTLNDHATGTGGFNGGDLITDGDSTWNFNKDSHVNNGDNQGTLNIGDYDVTFDNLTNDGTINLNVNSDTGAGGSITVTGTADGEGTVHIDTTGNGKADPNQVLLGKVTGDGTEHWQWDPIDWGIDTIIKDGDHFIKQGTSPAGAVLNSSVAIQQAMWFAQQNSLLKRMGELRYGARASRPLADKDVRVPYNSLIENIWLRSYGQQLNIGSQVAGKAYEQLIYGVDLGTDHKFTISADSDLYLGVYAGYGRSDLDYRTPGADGEINSYYGGLYATWLHSSGFYIDATVKAASVDNNLKAPHGDTQLKANYSDINLGGSLEIGNKFTFADDWFIEPQFQVNYLHILAEDYQAGPLTISAQDLDALQLRLGSLFGRTINLTNSGILQPYLKISGVETISSGGAIRNGYQHTRANTDGARAELGVGLIWQLDTNNQLHLDYEASFGDKYDKPWGLTAGYRHQF